jgi:hypothetical protein
VQVGVRKDMMAGMSMRLKAAMSLSAVWRWGVGDMVFLEGMIGVFLDPELGGYDFVG